VRRLLGVVALLFVSTAAFVHPAPSAAARPAKWREADDAVVVAVIDFNVVPYHWDFLASKMPQHADRDPSNDLPLEKAPHTWLPGFPDPDKAFKSYRRFDLSLEDKDPDVPTLSVDGKDRAKWEKVKDSTFKKINYYWFPDTKIIGAIEFGTEKLHGTPQDHGAGVTSVSVGNLHGTCPECLLVFINLDDGNEAEAIRWAMKQPWIDVITNSYGRGNIVPKIYNGPDEEDQRKASERGQTIFFSAGNGFENAFTATNPTYMSSEKGPDWLVTVGAVSPGENNYYSSSSNGHASYVGAGKPADIAGLGRSYPSAYTSPTVGGTGPTGFSGTSNAAPTIAGMYARALYVARKALPGPSRIQRNGVIAAGSSFECGRRRPDCEFRDGRLTAVELRARLFHGAIHTAAGMTTYAGGQTPPIGEEEFLNEGHGTYFARESGKWSDYMKEFARIIDPLFGNAKPLRRPEGEREWMIVDSFCRQHIWGAWTGGYYVEGKTDLPGPAATWPVRSMLEMSCPGLQPPP